MKNDQDLIFEAYAETLNESVYKASEDEDTHFIDRGLRPGQGAVNLLEQLKQEMPELEDKVNQILEKVFDAVDILKQETYVNDPQLKQAHESLIEGDF